MNVLACDVSKSRPWKLFSAGADCTVAYYKGPPFKKGVEVGKAKGKKSGWMFDVKLSPDDNSVAFTG